MEATRARGFDPARVHLGFGFTFTSAFELPGLPTVTGREPEVEIRLAERAEIEAAWSGPATERAVAELAQDGLVMSVERGAAGDHRFAYADRAAFHVDAAGTTVLCAPADPDAPEWRRVLLDSILATVSLVRGFEALHAAAVLGTGGVVALVGRTGGGKTTLAAELLRRGHALVCDDVLALSRVRGRVVGHPAPPLMNVPAAADLPDGLALAAIGEETWLAAAGGATEPAPVAAVCFIDRRRGGQAAVIPGRASPLDLLVHGLRSGSAPGRRRARFELLADLAAQAPSYVLEAGPQTPAAELAELLESHIPALEPEPAGAPS